MCLLASKYIYCTWPVYPALYHFFHCFLKHGDLNDFFLLLCFGPHVWQTLVLYVFGLFYQIFKFFYQSVNCRVCVWERESLCSQQEKGNKTLLWPLCSRSCKISFIHAIFVCLKKKDNLCMQKDLCVDALVQLLLIILRVLRVFVCGTHVFRRDREERVRCILSSKWVFGAVPLGVMWKKGKVTKKASKQATFFSACGGLFVFAVWGEGKFERVCLKTCRCTACDVDLRLASRRFGVLRLSAEFGSGDCFLLPSFSFRSAFSCKGMPTVVKLSL